MKRVNSVTYDVRPGEKIRLEVTPTNFSGSMPSIEAVLDGDELPNTGSKSAPVYKFTVSKPAGKTHRVLTEFTFQFDSPDDAFYQVSISGQSDVGCPCGLVVSKDDEVKEAGIRFRVKAGA